MQRHLPFPLSAWALQLLCAALLLAGCNGSRPDDRTPEDPETGQSETDIDDRDKRDKTASRVVCLTEFNCVRDEHEERFKYWDGSTPVDFDPNNTRQTLVWNELKTAVNALNVTHPLGIRIHYGLVLDGTTPKLTWALEPLKLTKKSAVFYEAEELQQQPLWQVRSDGKLQDISRGDWEISYQATYLDRIVVQRDVDTVHLPLVPGFDPTAYTFHWDTLQTFHVQNQEPAEVRINAIATPSVRRDLGHNTWYEADWRQRVAITAVNSAGDDLLDDDVDPSFEGKALDLGASCPPNCGLIALHAHGLTPTTACRCP